MIGGDSAGATAWSRVRNPRSGQFEDCRPLGQCRAVVASGGQEKRPGNLSKPLC